MLVTLEACRSKIGLQGLEGMQVVVFFAFDVGMLENSSFLLWRYLNSELL